ncbi:MAG: FISUMP domain-containing protein [Prolixibacteraceae bacterium]
MKRSIIYIFLLLSVLSCRKLEQNNPFDSACPKEIWTPTDFKAVQNGTSVTLTWSQPMNNISGFKLTKMVDPGSATDLTPQSKGITTLVDPTLTGGKLHTYTLVAYAGNNQSNIVTATVTPILAAGGITTAAAASITAISATSGATIASDGGSTITARGVCWATTTAPTIAGSKTTDGTGTGTFTSSITGLVANTIYFVRAYATNSVGTTYGTEISFRTFTGISTISTTNATNITALTATSGGNITSDGGAAITARGVCWATTSNPTIAGSKTTDGAGIGTFSSALTNLTPNTTYYVRTYSTNSTGTTYGNEVTFKTLTGISILTTAGITNITLSTASGGGTIIDDGGAAITARGICWGSATNPTINGSKTTDGAGIGSFTSSMAGLTPNTTYYVRTYATNAIGTTYGNEVSFKSLTGISSLTTASLTNITASTANGGGTITDDGGSAITARGVCWGTATNPTITGSKTVDGSGTGTFISSISGLIAGTTYYVRAYSTNSLGTYYGNSVSFTSQLSPIVFNSSKSYGSLNDVDGNTYKTITIGTQTWLAENLKTTKYNDGTDIPLITDGNAWPKLTSSGYCWYNNDMAAYKSVYGALYNWYTINTGKLCPSGWHVPDITEYLTLINYLGGSSIAGGKLKEGGTTHWDSPNTNATNETGFSAIPSGLRFDNAVFDHSRLYSDFWLSTEYDANNAYSHINGSNGDYDQQGSVLKTRGESVRCLQNQAPTVTTITVSNVTSSTCSTGGNIPSDGGITVTARGVCWSTTTAPTISNSKTTDGTGTGSFTSSITGLTAGTTYYVRAYATNSGGTAYGNEVSFKTTSVVTGSVTDADGNVYSTITIGKQVWMGSNLKTTKYNDNTAIPLVTDNTAWAALTTPSYCWYNNDATTNKNTYGALYNWYTVNTGKLCPTGWHVPTDPEWTVLTTYLGGQSVAGGKLKETGTNHWLAPNSGATNETSFTGMPGGCRFASGEFYYINNDGRWWSTSLSSIDRAIQFIMVSYNGTGWQSPSDFGPGYSVRCISGELTPPTLSTTAISGITSTLAASGGNISSEGGAAVTARGVCWNTTSNPTIANPKTTDGTGTGSFTSSMTGLSPGTTYYVRAYAINSGGTSYGNEINFTTAATLPTFNPSSTYSYTSTSITIGNTITSDGGASVTAKGVCWSTATSPTTSNSKTTDGSGSGNYTSNITGLTAGTTYYIRPYAINSIGTVYGSQVTITTAAAVPLTVTDADGNVYSTVTIGTQLWMASNLKTTKYNDNSAIPLVTDNTAWANLTTPGYCWYNNDATTYKSTYGALYNWYTVNTGKLCPTGWHVPSDSEWSTLTTFLGGVTVSGGKLKETGITHWTTPNTNATNESGFTGLPGGQRFTYGTFDQIGVIGYWWSSTESNANQSFGRYLNYGSNITVTISNNKYFGFSIRCLKD